MVRFSIEDLPPFPEDLHLAPIATISSARLQERDPTETARMIEACQTYGFFYLDLRDTKEGEQLLNDSEALLELAKEVFALPAEEKLQYHLKKGVSLFGYKAPGTVKLTDPERRPDSTEFFNIGKDLVQGLAPGWPYPPAITAARDPLLNGFTRRAHECGMLVLRTLARGLDLSDEEAFVRLNRFDMLSGDHCRLTRKFPHPSDKNAIGLPSHTDFGSVTILFNWLGGLQIESRTAGRVGQWEWVKPMAGYAIINLGDAMVRFTNGALKSAKHRVVPSPGPQVELDRYSVVYFVRPHNEALMQPLPEFANGTHVKVGGKVSVDDDENKVYTAGEWMVKRSIQLGS
ncbi:hypothetical protein VTK73DRAFT_7262 [Phialemonium thermophilum]|uniref:Fe2OG dioxygenase domain-containing protein n=1 Tax=Phialemonium thermophilum TaxID=223376 RepID=A0ABR3XT24_9PEZI